MRRCFKLPEFEGYSRILGAFQRTRKRFVADEAGTTTVEFVLLATPFLAFLYYILGLGYMYLNATALEDAAQRASRQIRIGAVASANVNKDGFKKMVCDELLITEANCLSDIVVDVTSNPDISQLDTAAPTNGGQLDSSKETFEPGDPSDYVIVKTYLPMSSLNSLFSLLDGGSDPTFILSAVEVFRNEPYE